MSASEKSRIIQGKLFADDRGFLKFVNEFDFKGVRRFYQVENFSPATIRAFHGHMREAKYVYVASGSALICVVALDDPRNPSRDRQVERHVLSAADPRILYIPPAHANGFKVLEADTRIIFFSTATLEESCADDCRFAFDYWGADIWATVNR